MMLVEGLVSKKAEMVEMRMSGVLEEEAELKALGEVRSQTEKPEKNFPRTAPRAVRL